MELLGEAVRSEEVGPVCYLLSFLLTLPASLASSATNSTYAHWALDVCAASVRGLSALRRFLILKQ